MTCMKVKNDIMTQADIFHIAKHVIKHTSYMNDYEVSFSPINMNNVINDLSVWIEGQKINHN